MRVLNLKTSLLTSVAMANVDGASAAADGGEAAGREKRATHFYLLPDGVAVINPGTKDARPVDITEATGYRYQDEVTKETFDFYPVLPKGVKPGNTLLMLALFGAKTQAINEASAARQARAKGDFDGSDLDALRARFGETGLADGLWLPESTREGGPRFNAELLAEAIAAAKGSGTSDEYLAKIRANPEYGPKAWTVKEVKAHYNRLKAEKALSAGGATSKGLGDL